MSESNIASDAKPGSLFDRRTFLAAAGAAGLAGCARGGPSSVRILYGDAPGTLAHGILQIFARALGKYGLRASVEAVPRGAGKLAAQMLAEAPRDGSVVGQMFTGLIYTQLLGEEGFALRLSDFEWIGNYASDSRALIVSAKAGVTRFDQLLRRLTPITVPASTTRGSIFNEVAIIRHLTGARIKAIPGFPGGARTLAVVSGEVDGMVGSLDSMNTLLDLPGARILMRLTEAPIPPGTPGQSPEGTPTLRTLSRGPDAAPLLQLMESYAQLGRIMALPPGTPAPVVEQWRKRFAEVVADPDFRKQLSALRVSIHYRSGTTVGAQLKALTDRQSVIAPALRRALAS